MLGDNARIPNSVVYRFVPANPADLTKGKLLFDVTRSYTNGQPLRFLAQGRDASATIYSGFSGRPGFQNDGDNEIAGIHVSDGDPSIFGILGAKIPLPFVAGWRRTPTLLAGGGV